MTFNRIDFGYGVRNPLLTIKTMRVNCHIHWLGIESSGRLDARFRRLISGSTMRHELSELFWAPSDARRASKESLSGGGAIGAWCFCPISKSEEAVKIIDRHYRIALAQMESEGLLCKVDEQ